MAYCRKCGKEIDDEAIMCVHCGVPTDLYNKKSEPEQSVSETKKAEPANLKEEAELFKEKDPGMVKTITVLNWIAIIGIFLAFTVSFLFYPLLSLPAFIYSFVIMSNGYKRLGSVYMLMYLLLGIFIWCFNFFVLLALMK